MKHRGVLVHYYILYVVANSMLQFLVKSSMMNLDDNHYRHYYQVSERALFCARNCVTSKPSLELTNCFVCATDDDDDLVKQHPLAQPR